LDNPVLNPIFLGDYWSSPSGQLEQGSINGFAQEFGHSAMANVVSQYGVGQANFGGSTQLSGASPKSVNDAGVQKLVQQAIASGGVKPNAQGVYMVFLPPGTELVDPQGNTSKQGLGGYHSSYLDANGKPVYYVAVAYAQMGNGINFDNVPVDGMTIAASHEVTETETDPDVNSQDPSRQIGWYDDGNNAEIGDLAIDMLPLDQTFQKDAAGHAVQVEWSNKDGAFEIAPRPS
jgi:hypothetical protein